MYELQVDIDGTWYCIARSMYRRDLDVAYDALDDAHIAATDLPDGLAAGRPIRIAVMP